MDADLLKEMIRQELPQFMQTDPSFRAFVLRVSREEFVSKAENESRFDQMLAELKRDREANERRWQEHIAKYDADRAESEKRWQEHQAKYEAERAADRAESEKRWQELMQRQGEKHDDLRTELKDEMQKLNRNVQALGARWGTQSEAAFRNALAGVLTESFKVDVLHFDERDTEGTVFGYPEQVEIDVIVRNGTVLLFELKSSVDKGDVALFERKCAFYERLSGRTVDRKIMVSPHVKPYAKSAFEAFGIECYSDTRDVVLDE